MSISTTLGNETWLRENEETIKGLFPSDFTDINQLNGVAIGRELRALTVDWNTKKEFEQIMVFFEQLGFLVREGTKIKPNTSNIFNE